MKKIRHKSSLKQKKRMDRILACLEKQKKRFQKEEIRQILIRHSALAQKIYVLRIRQKKGKGIKILLEILKDDGEQKILRLLAAEMLLKICQEKAFEKILDIANEKQFPANLLAKFAMSRKAIHLPLDDNLIWKIKKAKPFYRLIYIFLVYQKRSIPNLKILLKDSHPIVAITAAYRLRKITSSKSLLKQVDQRLLKFIKYGNTHIKNLALQCFWKNPKESRFESNSLTVLFRKVWLERFQKYKYTLCESLKGHVSLKLSALEIIIEHSKKISKIKNRKVFSDVYHQVQKLYYSGKLKYQTGACLGILSRKEEFLKILTSPTEFWFFHYFILRFSFDRRDKITVLCHFLQKRLNGPVQDRQDRMFRQVILIYLLEIFKGQGIFPILSSLLDKAMGNILKSKDIHLQRAGVMALGSSKFSFGNIKKLKTLLKSSDFYTRKAAAGSLASLLLEYDKEKLPQLNQNIKKMDKSIRESVAWVYYYRRLKIGLVYLFKIRRMKKLSFLKKKKISAKEWIALKSAIQIFPHPRFFYETSSLFFREKKYFQAQKMAKKAILYSQGENNVLQNMEEFHSNILLGNIYMRQKKYSKALSYLQKAEKENPFFYLAQKYLADCYLSIKDFPKSRKHYYFAYLCQPDKEHYALAELWKSFGPTHFSQKKHLVLEEGYLLPYIAFDHLTKNRKKECIKILQIMHEIVGLRQEFFATGVFHDLCNHPWVRRLPE